MEPLIVINGDVRTSGVMGKLGGASMEPLIVINGDPIERVGLTGPCLEASMEPLIVINGDGPPRSSSRSAWDRFNGAVDRDQRRPLGAAARASGPRRLQWSR